MIKAHKIRLHPTAEQANYFARAAGISRFWTWAKRLRLFLKGGLAAPASKARSEANRASILPMTNSNWVIIGSGSPSSAG